MKTYVKIGARNRTLLTGWGLSESYRHKIAGTECQIRKSLDYSEGFVFFTCSEKGSRAEVAAQLQKEIRESGYTQEFFDAIDKTYKDVVTKLKRLISIDPKSLSNSELSKHYETFLQIYVTTIHPMVLAIYASDLSPIFEQELKKILGKDATPEKMLEYTALLLTPTRLTTVQKEEQLLFEIQDAFEKANPGGSVSQFESFAQTEAIRKKLNTVAELYGWFHMEYIGEPKKPEDYIKIIRERIDDLRRSGGNWKNELSPQMRLDQIVKSQTQFMERAGISDFFKRLKFAMQEYLIVLDYSKADLIEGIYYFRPFLHEIGCRVGLPSWIDVRFLLPDEVKDLLKQNKKVTHDYIAPRKRNSACLLEHDEIKIYYGSEAVKMAEKLIEEENISNARECKGIIGFPGKVVGTATLVRNAAERDTFRTGNILICHDITTELTSVTKKAAAIVADRGGILSHTAIVAREFKIPCIVGTKIGTKIIKNGDRVEVDADKGIVRILN